eukprot:SAG31_NODE_5506_length_2494_cov_1.681135_2_plen_97_part_00
MFHLDFCASGTGSCKAVWSNVSGDWKIVKDEISFVPKPKAMTLEEAQALLAREKELEENLEKAIEAEDFGLCGDINKELEALKAKSVERDAVLAKA